MDPAVSLIEDLTLTAWPALRTLHHGGWVVRMAGGHTRRANSVNAVVPGAVADDGLFQLAERAYGAAGLDCQFRMTPLCPPDLPARLRARGYEAEKASAVQVLHGLDGFDADPAVFVGTAPDAAWTDAYVGMTGVPPARQPFFRAILDAIAPPCLFAVALEQGVAMAVALGVVDRGHVGLFDVATRPDRRGEGWARRTITTVLAGARDLGADRAYLQVDRTNAPALALYGRMGFRELYGYEYWRRGGA